MKKKNNVTTTLSNLKSWYPVKWSPDKKSMHTLSSILATFVNNYFLVRNCEILETPDLKVFGCKKSGFFLFISSWDSWSKQQR